MMQIEQKKSILKNSQMLGQIDSGTIKQIPFNLKNKKIQQPQYFMDWNDMTKNQIFETFFDDKILRSQKNVISEVDILTS